MKLLIVLCCSKKKKKEKKSHLAYTKEDTEKVKIRAAIVTEGI
jgi:hypothetical protein